MQSPEVANERQVLQHSALVQGGDDGWQCSGGSSPEPSTTCADRRTKSTATKPEGQMKVDESLSRKGTGKVEQCAASVPDGCVEGDTEAVRDGGRKCAQEVHRLRDGTVAEEEGSLLCVAPVVKSDDAVDDAGVGG